MESGLIVDGAVSENRRPESSVSESINMDFDMIGGAKLRTGLTQIGSTLTGNILGAYYFVDTVSASPKSRLIVVNATIVYYLNGSSYSSIRTGLTSGSKARFTTYLNFVFMVNGTEATAIWDGDTGGGFVTNGNATNAPKGKYTDNFKSRVWIAGDPVYPDRLYYSSLASEATPPVIAWSADPTTGSQWFDVSPSDGQSITGLHRTRGTLLVFKQNTLFKVYSISQADPDPYYGVGTYSQESVIETKSGVFFHHSSGFYQYNIYGQVVEISRPIIDIVRAISVSNYTSVSAWLDTDGDHINWSIGNVTYGGVTYSNMVVRYSISTQVWTHRSYPVQFICSTSSGRYYTDGTNLFNIVGDTGGKTYEYNTGKTDNGSSISYAITHRWENIDGLLSTRKTLGSACFNHYGASGANVSAQVDTTRSDWIQVGQLQLQNTGFNNLANIKGRRMRIRVAGQSTGETFEYDGYELLGVTDEVMQFPDNR